MCKSMCVFVCLVFVSCSTVVAQREISSVADIPSAASEFASAYYDASTGDIYLSVGDGLVLLGLTDAPFGFVDGVFDPSRVRVDTPLGVPDFNNEVETGWSADFPALDTQPSGIFNIGNLLPAGIPSIGDFDLLYPDAEVFFAAQGNANRAPLNFIPVAAQQIPEPGSAGLLMLAGAFFASRRRR